MTAQKKRFALGTLLAAVLLIGACSNSGSREAQTSGGGVSPAAGDTYEIAMYSLGPDQRDLGEVSVAISEITKRKIGATVKITNIDWGNWNQQITLMLAGNEKVDLMVTSTPWYNYASQVAKGQLLPLDDLLAKYGQGTAEFMKPYLDAARVDGKIYGIPTYRDLGASFGPTMVKSILDKYQIDPASIHNLDDLEKVFATIHQGEPNMAMIVAPQAGNTLFQNYYNGLFDILGDGNGVIDYAGDPAKVVNMYETQSYKDLVMRARKWQQLGYIAKDAATTKEAFVELMKAGKGFSILGQHKPGFDVQQTTTIGFPVQSVDITPAIKTTTYVTLFMWSIPKNSKNPEKAMQMIELMYTDPDIENLLDYGIEGKHWIQKGNVIGFPEGVDATNSGYNLQYGWLNGNQTLSHIWEGNPEDLWDQLKAFNDGAETSPAYGFAYNPEAVKTETAAVENVVAQYRMGLDTGSVDPEKVLPKFIADLKAAGIDKIIAEKQRQYDKWIADNHVDVTQGYSLKTK